MSFHGGSRGSSRGRISKAGGSRGRGRPASRGRGAFRGGRGKPIFDSARIAQQKEQEDTDSESHEDLLASDQDESDPEDEFSADEEDPEKIKSARPYVDLMQILSSDAVPQAKRRKLDFNLDIPSTRKYAAYNHVNEDLANVNTDLVDEAEEGSETAIEGSSEETAEDEEDHSDPFEVHFAHPDNNVLGRKLESIQQQQWTSQKFIMPTLSKAFLMNPGLKDNEGRFLEEIVRPGQLKLKQKLANVVFKRAPTFDGLESRLAPYIFNYRDVLYCERNPMRAESLRRLLCLHAVNHVFKTRDRVLKNNARLTKEEALDLDLRDQGFTRPKVLFIIPTRESCVRMVDIITALCEPEQQENRKRFDETYIDEEAKFSDEKPADFRELFDGNDDDMFRLGLKFTRKTIKFFSQFYNSDIIFASPLGLRMAIEGKDDKKGDSDFLSSIEVVLVDQADALLMQNWEHMEYIFQHLNLQPREAHGCDFSRVRSWYLDNNAQYFRQTITLTAFNTPEINTLLFNQLKNWSGKLRINAAYQGSIQELGLRIKQTFSRLDIASFAEDPDARFTYFTNAIVPSLTRRVKDNVGTLVFVPSYLDFVRLRNYFSTSATTGALSFGSISEYTSGPEAARARSHFLSGRHSVLLYTERAHHFRRYRVRGVKRVVMYSLPDNPTFYEEIVGGYLGRSVQEGSLNSDDASLRVVFSKWDVMKLERIVGTDRVGKMIRETGDTFDFV